ncbi:PF20097 family protein [Mahella sp.]|uniref:PF20097 family protein n=1 Tax=Mahella sp. TaxID=2798721 RepID=UPI0025B7BFEC|nr:PF20097 family protein [Mahella sp.]MBZ4665204.1 hypothetical protein [Mahella sp.]
MDNENEIETCPWCGKKMERGTFRSRGGNYFLPMGEKVPLTYFNCSMEKRNAIPFPPFIMGPISYPIAFVCRSCRKIIIPY